jgi:outer membrane protein TolC
MDEDDRCRRRGTFMRRGAGPRVLLWPAVLALSACASYAPVPLPDKPDLRSDLAALSIDPAQLPPWRAAPHPFDPQRPLDIDEIATIAVANNPDLKAARAKAGISRAQAFAAGLLPNPQLTFDYGFLTGGPGVSDALTAGVVQEIVPFLTRSSRLAAGEAARNAAELDLLWQEWQVVSQARQLFIHSVALDWQRAILAQSRALFDERYRRSSSAMRRGDETLPPVVSDLAALSAVETQLHDQDQQILKTRHDLDALLGLAPEAKLSLADGIEVPPIDAAAVAKALPDLARRRPDLLALQAGYAAQEEKVRQAVIMQFPALGIGTARAKDTSAVYTQAVSVTLSLPIFDRNQGNIAIERATREQLRAEYQARLDAADIAAERLVSEQQLLEEQYRANGESIAQLRQATDIADRAYRARDLDERSWVDLHGALLAKQLETLKLEETLLVQRATLQTLIGSDLPTAAPRPRRAP